MAYRRRYRRKRTTRRIMPRLRRDKPFIMRPAFLSRLNSYRIRQRYANQFMRIKRKIQFSGPSGNGFPVDDWNFLSSTSVDNYAQFNFTVQLSNMANAAEYTALYEQYRIRHVKIRVQYMSSTEYFSGTSVGGIQALNGIQFMGWTDPDDISAYANSGSGWRLAMESNRASMKRFPNVKNNTYTVYLKYPKVLSDVQAGSTDTYVNTKTSPWLSTTNTAVDHYGFKFFANSQPTTASINHSFRFFMTMYVDFRSAK